MDAVIHTKDVVLGNRYIPLELAYRDVYGLRCHFHITSPMNFSKMKRMYPDCRPDVEVTVTGGTPYSNVLKFLQEQHDFLQSLHPNLPVIFAYKVIVINLKF